MTFHSQPLTPPEGKAQKVIHTMYEKHTAYRLALFLKIGDLSVKQG